MLVYLWHHDHCAENFSMITMITEDAILNFISTRTGIGNWVQCFPVYPGLNSSSGFGFRIPAFPYAPDFSFTCIFPFLWLLYCEVLMMLVCNSKEFQFLNELHELNQAFFHSQVVNSDRVERKKNVIKI